MNTLSNAKWRMIALDDSNHWSSRFRNKLDTGRIFGLYLFDANRAVNCAELTPSYELHHITSETEHQLNDEAHEEFVRADRDDLQPVQYVHCRSIDAHPAEHFLDLDYSGLDPEDFGINDSMTAEEKGRVHMAVVQHIIDQLTANPQQPKVLFNLPAIAANPPGDEERTERQRG